ncbi:MAG: hypothetical protein O210_OD1C00001G0684 [Parcubacteria bacterium RAAC4_OD1_1]|nr:MAG: hypothetical protein O210_OD1C00001G0684 [Parcubacteria bacterium RAAC4_OD1_1]
MKISRLQKNKGAAMMIVVFFFVIISLTILVGVIFPVVREFGIAKDNIDSKKAYFASESGLEDVLYRVKNGMQVDNIEDLVIDSTTAQTQITDISGGKKQITSLGDQDSHQRKVDIIVSTASGVSFNYGVLVGQGGIYLDSGIIYGNVYANGPIIASSSGSNLISGSVISANSPGDISSDQSNGVGVPPYNVTFAKTSSYQDVAQSFQVSNSNALNKIQIYVKKVGSPSNVVIKIVNDSNGNPGSTTLASGTLSSSSVTTSYGWINVSFDNNPVLEIGKTYWLVVDASYSNSKYYVIGANSNGYGNGVGKIGQFGSSWSNTTPSGLDYYFNIFLGGATGFISGVDQYNRLNLGTEPGSIVHANTVQYVNTTGALYCKIDISNNKECLPRTDPVYIEYPISEANILEWENGAETGGIYNGDYNVGWAGATLGPKKINGSLSVSGGGVLNITGNLWVTGNLNLNGGGTIKLDSSYGENDAVVVVDGTISVSGGGNATGSGVEGSYIMLLTKSNSISAADISGGAGAMILYAPNGTLKISGGTSLKEATAYKMNITGNSSITYESGLTNNNFSSGPSGTWSINSWGEIE